jgi:hypothetical protein
MSSTIPIRILDMKTSGELDRHWRGNNEIVIEWFFVTNIRKAQSSPCPPEQNTKTSMEIEISCKRGNPI